MPKWEDQYIDEVKKMEVHHVPGPYYILPVIHKRCFVPCDIGRCACRETVHPASCVIAGEENKKYHLQEMNSTLNFLNEKAAKVYAQYKKDNP